MAESQQPYPYTEIVNLKQKAQWIETSLSIERLLPYMRSAGYDYEKHFINIYIMLDYQNLCCFHYIY